MRKTTGTLSDLTTALNEAIVELSNPVAQADGTLSSATAQLNALLVWAESTRPAADGSLTSAVSSYNKFVFEQSLPSKGARVSHKANGFTEVVERSKGFLKSKKPGTDQYAFTTQVGGRGWHFGDGPFTSAHEVDTAWVDAHPIDDAPWLKKMVLADYNAYALSGNPDFDAGQLIKYVHPATGAEVSFEPQQLQWTNDLDQLSPIEDPQNVAATITDDELKWTDAYGAGIDFKWKAHPVRLAKFVDIASLSQLGSPPQFIIDGGNPVLKIGFIFQKSAGVGIYVDGVLWDEKANNPQVTSNNVEFRLSLTGKTLWWFRKPLAWDSGDAEISPFMRLRTVANSLFVEILTPWTVLQSSTYPVTIDTIIDVDTAASADDGYIYSNSSFNNSGVAIHCGDHSVASLSPYSLYARFAVSGLSGATINTSYVSFQIHTSTSGTPANCVLYAEDAASPSNPNNRSQYVNKTETTASVAWNPTGNTDETVQSPSINSIIQELADSYDPSYVMILYKYTGSAGVGLNKNEFETYDKSSFLPSLYIDYTAASGDPAPSVSDAVTVTDTATISPLVIPDLSEQEDVTVTDTPTLRMHLDLPASQEDVTVGDTATLDPVSPTEVSETEAVTVGEAVTVDPLILEDISEQEDVTVGESVTVEPLAIEISEVENVTVTDTATLDPVFPIDISEQEDVTVTDTPTVQIPVGGEQLSVPAQQEDVTVGESVTVVLDDLSISEVGNVTVTDTAQIAAIIMGLISVYEDVTVTDTATMGALALSISESEAVNVTDLAPEFWFTYIQTLTQTAGIVSAEAFENNHVIANVAPGVPGAEDRPKGFDHDAWIQY